MEPELIDSTIVRCCRVPKQSDGHSCGWRVVYNAQLLLEAIYRIQGNVSKIESH